MMERVRLAAHWALHKSLGWVDRPVDMTQAEGIWYRVHPEGVGWLGMKWVGEPWDKVGKVWRRRIGDHWEYRADPATAEEQLERFRDQATGGY